MDNAQLKNVMEAALLAAGRPLNLDELRGLIGEGEDAPSRQDMRELVESLQADYAGRGIELKEVASGYRVQIRGAMAPWLTRLWEERAPRFSRALMETLAIIAYRQPVTRGEVEEIRGVAVTTNIVRTLLERGWVRVVGHRDVPGKPAMFGTTREFLDYFGLRSLDELPTLEALKDFDTVNVQLELPGEADSGAEVVAVALSTDAEEGDQPTLAPEPATAGPTADAEPSSGDDPDEATVGLDEALAPAGNVVPLKSR